MAGAVLLRVSARERGLATMFKTDVATGVANRPAAREIQRNEGLCRDCMASDTCTFPRDPSRPVWSCEEFEGVERPPSRAAASGGLTSAIPPRVEDAATTLEFKGLCRECARRPTCRYPKPAGGVWHCDELE
jgi:hypothetical protein